MSKPLETAKLPTNDRIRWRVCQAWAFLDVRSGKKFAKERDGHIFRGCKVHVSAKPRVSIEGLPFNVRAEQLRSWSGAKEITLFRREEPVNDLEVRRLAESVGGLECIDAEKWEEQSGIATYLARYADLEAARNAVSKLDGRKMPFGKMSADTLKASVACNAELRPLAAKPINTHDVVWPNSPVSSSIMERQLALAKGGATHAVDRVERATQEQ